MAEKPKYNTCPRCARSGVGACDDFPRCQEPVTLAGDVSRDGGSDVLIARPFGDGWEILGHVGDIQLGTPTPEEQQEAAMRYIKARYAEAVSWSGAFGEFARGILGMAYDRTQADKPDLDTEGACVSCGVHWYLCNWCGKWWAGSHICEDPRTTRDPDIVRGTERVTGEVYDPDTDTWALPPDK